MEEFTRVLKCWGVLGFSVNEGGRLRRLGHYFLAQNDSGEYDNKHVGYLAIDQRLVSDL